jgi:signal transduction histidine kinase
LKIRAIDVRVYESKNQKGAVDMDPDSKPPHQERESTNKSLRTERTSTDEAVAERRGIDRHADEVVERARERADAVLETARATADESLSTTRALEDQVIESERAAADDHLYREREEEARTLATWLPLEREKTDRDLLTERARSDDKLAHRDDFLGMVSHDLRSLLCGVVLEATALSGSASQSAEGRLVAAGMKRLQQYAARMNRLIGDLIDVVSIDAGRLAIEPERGNAGLLLGEAYQAFASAASEKGISLDLQTGAAALWACFDHSRMLQVLANLIANALKFTPRGGAIVIRCERIGDELRFCVSDTGIGIAPSMLEAVFQRFWQISENDQRGLGLGLHISKCIVEAHGGKIWAESTPGEGSAFYFAIPAGEQISARSGLAEQGEAPGPSIVELS